MARNASQLRELFIAETSDGDPAIRARAPIGAVRRRGFVRGTIAEPRPDASVCGPVEDGGPGKEKPCLALRSVDPLALARALAVMERAEDRQGVAVGAHPIEIGIAPADGHRRLRKPRHLGRSRESGGDRAHGSQPAVSSVAPHAGLLDIDDVGADAAQHVIAEPEALQHARRKPLGDNIADSDEGLGDLQPAGIANVERKPALAAVLVVELTAHVRIGDPGQRRGRRAARLSAANRRHGGETRVGIFLPLDLQTLRTHGGEEPRAAGRRQEPRKIENPDVLQREGLAVQRVQRWPLLARRRFALRAAAVSTRTARACSPRAGALRPTCQLVAADSHLLVQ